MADRSFKKKRKLAYSLWLVVAVFASCCLAKSTFPQDTGQALYKEGAALYEWGDYEKALAKFEELLASAPKSDLFDDAQYMSGQCFLQLERYDEAITSFYNVAYGQSKNNRSADALSALAGILHRQGNARQSLEIYEDLFQKYPDSKHTAYALTCIGWLRAGMGDTVKARTALQKVKADYPNSPYAKTAEESLKLLDATGVSQETGSSKIEKTDSNRLTVALKCDTVAPIEGSPVTFKATVLEHTPQDKLAYQWFLDGQPVPWTGFSPIWQGSEKGVHHVGITVSDGNTKGGTTIAVTVSTVPLPPAGSTSSIFEKILLLDGIPPLYQKHRTDFSSGETAYVWIETTLLNAPHKLEVVWLDPSGKNVKREGCELRGWGAGETFWSGLKMPNGRQQGRWHVHLLIDGNVQKILSFILEP